MWGGGDTKEEYHEHVFGEHGGVIISLGRDHYHAEVIFEKGSMIKLYMLGHNDSEVLEVPQQKLTAYVREAEKRDSTPIEFKPEPQAGDSKGMTSLFVTSLPDKMLGSDLVIVVPSITIEEKRYRFSIVTAGLAKSAKMPEQVSDAKARELFLTPGGKYTQEDIEANGHLTAAQKYRNFHSAHNMSPEPGDRICPVTDTQANSACTWIVDGQAYEFCCPPCIEEFVARAKEHPEQIKPANKYVKE